MALHDLLAYLEQSLHVAPGIYEIGGADITTYREMIAAYAAARGLRPRRIIDIPWLTPHLSSYWVDLVTPVDRSVSHALIESLVTEVVVVGEALVVVVDGGVQTLVPVAAAARSLGTKTRT